MGDALGLKHVTKEATKPPKMPVHINGITTPGFVKNWFQVKHAVVTTRQSRKKVRWTVPLSVIVEAGLLTLLRKTLNVDSLSVGLPVLSMVLL